MNIRGMRDGAASFFEWLMHLSYINLLWMVFTIAGLGIFGWAPATAASFSVLRKLFMAEEEVDSIFRTFTHHYKKEFVPANLIGIVLVFSAGTIYLSGVSMVLAESTIVPKVILGMVACLTGIIALFIFPVFCHFQGSFHLYIRHSLTIGIAHLHYAALLLFLLFAVYYMYSLFPVVMVFYFMSLPASIIMYVSLKIFKKIHAGQREETSGKKEVAFY
ncbi:YesL family protein [Alteribacillus sp. HJP-4]|uniref:YesL family protein n=1 Tax=Alteribacillus sp. HJP-4 TaxID=2775394 RepID=UPI0035CCF989